MLQKKMSRRAVLTGLGASALMLATSKASAASLVLRDQPSKRVLRLHNLHTNERCEAHVWQDGTFDQSEVQRLDMLLRDFRRDESCMMDKALYLQLMMMQVRLQQDVEFQIVSGYRSPATNEALRKRSAGVAKKSYHMTGQAIDLCIPDVHLSELRKVAQSLKVGGVGYYPKSGFIHIDTGPTRYWRG